MAGITKMGFAHEAAVDTPAMVASIIPLHSCFDSDEVVGTGNISFVITGVYILFLYKSND